MRSQKDLVPLSTIVPTCLKTANQLQLPDHIMKGKTLFPKVSLTWIRKTHSWKEHIKMNRCCTPCFIWNTTNFQKYPFLTSLKCQFSSPSSFIIPFYIQFLPPPPPNAFTSIYQFSLIYKCHLSLQSLHFFFYFSSGFCFPVSSPVHSARLNCWGQHIITYNTLLGATRFNCN